MLQFFYRAWADSQPACQADRPEDDRFAGYIARLTGAQEGAAKAEAFPLKARLHYAGLFISRRSAAALQDGPTHLLRTPVRILEFVGGWRTVEPEDLTRLGGARPTAASTLGGGAMLGGRVRMAQDAFGVAVTAASLDDYERFLPAARPTSWRGRPSKR